MSTEAVLEKPKQIAGVFSTGLALFSMFFGAGNLIFPLIIGRESGVETPYAILGLGISAVVFPFLGLIAMMLYSGNLQKFLGRIGKWPAFLLLLVLQISQGPFGALPRLVTLMHASLKTYFPSLSIVFFSFLICTLIFFLTIRPQKIVQFLGVILTPLLLFTLILLVTFGLINAPDAQPVAQSAGHYFGNGLKMGYQTTDLIAALLFATMILPVLSQGTETKQGVRKRMTYASLIAAGLLMASYIGLCLISAHHSWTFSADTLPEDLLQSIAQRVLGPWGGIVSATAVFLACLTTLISLAAVFAQYLQKDLLKERVGNGVALLITLGLTALIANLGFSGIVRFWGPILEVIYPGLIVLCLFNIAYSIYKVKVVQTPVFITLALATGGFFLT